MRAKLLSLDENRVAYILLISRNVTTSQISTTYIIHVVLQWHCLRKQDGRKQPVLLTFSYLLRYCVTPGSSSLSYSMSDFHCSPSANITFGSPISGMDGNSTHSFRILRYSSLVVIILFHWKWFCAYFCWRMYVIYHVQRIVAFQWLAWLSSMFKI